MIITTLTTLLVGAALVTAVAMYFWPKITWFFRKYIMPWFRNHMGNTAADLLAEIFQYIDNAMCWGRRRVKATWKWLVRVIRGEETTYKDNNDGTYNEQTKTTVQDENSGNVNVITHTRTVEYEDLPTSVRHEMNRRNLDKFKVNDREILANKFRDAAKENEDLSSKEIMEMTL